MRRAKKALDYWQSGNTVAATQPVYKGEDLATQAGVTIADHGIPVNAARKHLKSRLLWRSH